MVKGLEYGYKLFEFRWDASRYVGTAVEKPSKTDDFRCFWPGLPDGAADCSAPCGATWLKSYVVNGLGYGYKRCEFCWGESRYAGAAVEKLAKTDDLRCFWPRLPDATADCFTPCHPIWLKFYVVNGQWVWLQTT